MSTMANTHTQAQIQARSAMSNALDQQPMSFTQWAIFVVALLLNMIDGFDVAALSFAAHGLGEEFNLAAGSLGQLFSVALAGMMIGAMFLAPLADSIGRKPLLVACVLAIGITMLGMAQAQSLWQMLTLRFITGLGVGGMLAGLTALTSEYTPAKYRSLAIVSMTAGYPLGVSIGGLLAAPMIPEYGWRVVFYLGGGATLLMAAVLFALVPESLQFLSGLTTAKARRAQQIILLRLGLPQLPAELEQPQPVCQQTPTRFASIRALFSPSLRGQTLQLWLTFFLCFVSLYFLLSWIPKLLVNAGLSQSSGVLASTAFTGGGTLGIFVLGWLATYFSLARIICAFLLLAAVGLALFAWLNGLPYLFVSLAIIGFFHAGGFTGLYAVAAKIYPAHARVTGIGWALGLGRFGAVVGPYVGGLLIAANFNWQQIFLVFALPIAASGVLALGLKAR
ncbi:MFS transporter [Halioxenophilus aromaticivorans]|uniref:MFS transporter n=1 Tax=Halioxenophilus aromaticivorans TaxID=1306992 RepID=A0AAV3U658_9ALTE